MVLYLLGTVTCSVAGWVLGEHVTQLTLYAIHCED